MPVTKEQRKALATALKRVQRAQSKFWDALEALEMELGADVEDSTDWSTWDVDALVDLMDDEEKQ